MEDWKEQHKVLLDPVLYTKVKGICRIKGITIEEWVNDALRGAIKDTPEAIEAQIQAIREAGSNNHPTWIVEGMLREFESWRRRD